MNPKIPVLALALGACSANAGTFEVEDFVLDSTEDLVDVCSAQTSDLMYEEAKIFCFGYLAAAIDYHRAMASAPGMGPIACAERDGASGAGAASRGEAAPGRLPAPRAARRRSAGGRGARWWRSSRDRAP